MTTETDEEVGGEKRVEYRERGTQRSRGYRRSKRPRGRRSGRLRGWDKGLRKNRVGAKEGVCEKLVCEQRGNKEKASVKSEIVNT